MPATKTTGRNTKQLFALLKMHGLDKSQTVFDFTQGRTSSLKELSDFEFNEMVTRLIKMSPPPKPTREKHGTDAKGDKMRKKLIWILCSMGYLKIQQTGEYFHFENQVTRKANMPDILAVVERLGYLKKPLNSYTVKELPKLVAQFEKLKSNNWKSEANKAVSQLLGPSTSSGARTDKTK